MHRYLWIIISIKIAVEWNSFEKEQIYTLCYIHFQRKVNFLVIQPRVKRSSPSSFESFYGEHHCLCHCSKAVDWQDHSWMVHLSRRGEKCPKSLALGIPFQWQVPYMQGICSEGLWVVFVNVEEKRQELKIAVTIE